MLTSKPKSIALRRRRDWALRRETFQHIAAEREKGRKVRVVRERGERCQTRHAHSVPNWQGHLEAKATKGNEQALAAVRFRQRRTRQHRLRC